MVLKRGPFSVSFFQIVARMPLMRISCAGLLVAVSAGLFLLILFLSCLAPICRSVLFFTKTQNKPTAKGANEAGSD